MLPPRSGSPAYASERSLAFAKPSRQDQRRPAKPNRWHSLGRCVRSIMLLRGCFALNSDDELKMITERNKQLVQDIKTKVEEYEKQQVQLNKYKSDQKLLANEIKDTHEAFLMAKKYYKKFLKIYFTIESRNDGKQCIYLQFFTDVKKDSRNYSVQLLKDLKTKNYEVLQIKPGLDICKELQQKLQTTSDITGALCYIRQAFIKLKKGK